MYTCYISISDLDKAIYIYNIVIYNQPRILAERVNQSHVYYNTSN